LEETSNRLRQELVNTEEAIAAASKEGVIAQLSERVEKLTAANIELQGQLRNAGTANLDSTSANRITGGINNNLPASALSAKRLTPSEFDAIEDVAEVASLSVANGIIVLSVNAGANLRPGTEIKLLKDLEIIAQVKIININGLLVIANVLPGAKLDSVFKGDTLKFLR